ncbi:MAG: hypothetical protein ACYS18_07960 [Planctomycetota bacterium]
MKELARIGLCGVLAICVLAFCGCGKKADETKPLSEVEAEAEKMDAAKLKATAMEYKEAILAKQEDIAKVTAQLKEIPIANMLGEETKGLKADIDELNKSLSALKSRFDVYYNKLKEKGGDVSGLGL